MSNRVQNWVWHPADYDDDRLSGLRGNELLVLLALADEADDFGGSCFPSLRRIAKKCRISEGLARKVVRQLEAAGVVEIDRPERQGRGHHNRYEVLVPWHPTRIENTPDAKAHIVHPSGERVHEVPDSGPEKRFNAHAHGKTHTPRPTHYVRKPAGAEPVNSVPGVDATRELLDAEPDGPQPDPDVVRSMLGRHRRRGGDAA